ncbi:MAG: hypothetical protein AAFZ65_02810 [Planctomycetota bacterium]
MQSNRLRQTALSTAFASSLLTASAAAQVGPAPVLNVNGQIFEPSQDVIFTVSGTPGDIAFVLASVRRDEVFIPGLGTLGVDIGPGVAIFPFGVIPESGEVGEVCPISCDSAILEYPVFLQAVALAPSLPALRPPSEVVGIGFAGGDCGVCVDEAVTDSELKGGSAQHALWLPGLATDFQFIAGGDFVERNDGSARLTGVVASVSEPAKQLEVDVTLSNRIDPGDALFPPSSSPKLELKNSAYVQNGGSIDPDAWHYYEFTDGVLLGRGELEGGVLIIERAGPAFQVGRGANGKNGNYGASGWLKIEVLAEPQAGPFGVQAKGDFNLDLDRECVDCATAAEDHALTLKGIGKDLLFVDGGEFVENADGTATLTGIVVDSQVDDLRWQVDVLFTDRMNAGAANYPPASSPKLELPAGEYFDNGGDIQPDQWHYYLTTEGTLTGLDANDGAVVSLTRKGPAFQVGLGANGKNTSFGASGWLDWAIVSQPNAGPAYPASGKGDFNLDLTADCPPQD